MAAESTKLETDLPFVSLQPLLDLVDGDDDRNTFEHLVNPLLPEFIQQRKLLQANQVETDAYVSTLHCICNGALMNLGFFGRVNLSDQ